MRLTALVLGIAMAASSGAIPADAADALLYTATYVEVVPPSASQAAQALQQYRQATGADPGALRMQVLQRTDRQSQFVILAAWKDQASLDAHGAGAAAKALRDALGPLLASPNDERVHTALSLGGGSAAPTGPPVYAVTHVDVIPPRKDDGLVLLKQLAEDSRRDAGSIGFDVLQQTSRPNHFTVIEAWMDRSALDAHIAAAHTRGFRERLAPMNGALYDERFYVPLN
jgi:quinol monooxygenase YgiN